MRQPAPLLALVLLLALSPVGAVYAQQAAKAVESAQQRKSQAEQAKAALRERIAEVQARLDKKSAQYKRASDALKQSEKAISDTTRRLRALSHEIDQGELTLSDLQAQIDTTQDRLQADREALAAQLLAQYRSNLSPWSAMLSGQDPQTLGRELGYLSFVSGARVQIIDSLREGVTELSGLQAAQTQQQEQLAKQDAELKAQQQTLQRERKARQQLLVKLEGAIAAERAERDKLAQDEQRLGDLIESIGQEIAQVKADAQHAQAIRKDILEALPEGEGLKRGIALPAQGPIVARYGSSRPDGGDWRGVLIEVKPGAPVKAVAAGTVVYATWLRGFGNLIIVDHGDES
ncbi:MAG TPA: peptidoglycan DD-metalloendopeptidase family protein, partial [Orrella sp.]